MITDGLTSSTAWCALATSATAASRRLCKGLASHLDSAFIHARIDTLQMLGDQDAGIDGRQCSWLLQPALRQQRRRTADQRRDDGRDDGRDQDQ